MELIATPLRTGLMRTSFRKHSVGASATCLLLAAACATTQAPASAAARAPDAARPERPAIYEVFVRDFSPSGDFQGVTDGLGRIQEAGANVVWLMPIYPIGKANRKGSLGSPYAAADYRAVNPDFGTEADFRNLVRAVHARGMKLILDFVPNHTAFDHVWVREHPDRYTHDSSGKITVALDNDGKPTDYDRYEGSYGVGDVRRAVQEATERGVRTFGLAIEKEARSYLSRMFGPGGHEILPRPDALADALARLTAELSA